MIHRRIAAACALLALLAGAGAAQQETVRRVRFARGASSAVLQGSVVRGGRDRLVVGARAGQRLQLSVTSPEENAVFQIARPGGRGYLGGAGETDDARRWSGVLPATGDYVVVVGGTRGNTTYRLTVAIR